MKQTITSTPLAKHDEHNMNTFKLCLLWIYFVSYLRKKCQQPGIMQLKPTEMKIALQAKRFSSEQC